MSDPRPTGGPQPTSTPHPDEVDLDKDAQPDGTPVENPSGEHLTSA